MEGRRVCRQLADLVRLRSRARFHPRDRAAKAAALRRHWLDSVIVLVTAPVFGAFLSALRLARLARLLRLLRIGAILTRLIQRERALTSGDAFRFAALATLFTS